MEETKKREGNYTGYKYKWAPNKKKDNGESLKRNGRKKGSTTEVIEKGAKSIGLILDYTTYGAKKIEHPDNIAEGVKPGVLTINQAAREAGYNSIQNFYSVLNRNPELRKSWDTLRTIRRQYLADMAETNIDDALSKRLKINDKERVEFSFRFLEKTSKEYNPKQVIEQTVEEINPDRTSEDILNELASLLKK